LINFAILGSSPSFSLFVVGVYGVFLILFNLFGLFFLISGLQLFYIISIFPYPVFDEFSLMRVQIVIFDFIRLIDGEF